MLRCETDETAEQTGIAAIFRPFQRVLIRFFDDGESAAR